MQSFNGAEESTRDPLDEPASGSSQTRRQLRLFEHGRRDTSLSITGTWPRPAIVIDDALYQPFRLR